MAKGARASTRKANNTKLKSKVFGPVETARTARLSAKLLELASQPKPVQPKDDAVVEMEDGTTADFEAEPLADKALAEDMEVDSGMTKLSGLSKPRKGRIEKRSSRKAAIVFPKYKNGKGSGKSKSKKQ